MHLYDTLKNLFFSKMVSHSLTLESFVWHVFKKHLLELLFTFMSDSLNSTFFFLVLTKTNCLSFLSLCVYLTNLVLSTIPAFLNLPPFFSPCFVPIGLLMVVSRYLTGKGCRTLYIAGYGAGLIFTVIMNSKQLKTANMLLILKRMKYVLTLTTTRELRHQVGKRFKKIINAWT